MISDHQVRNDAKVNEVNDSTPGPFLPLMKLIRAVELRCSPKTRVNHLQSFFKLILGLQRRERERVRERERERERESERE